MEPTALVQWLILGGTLASVALPFAYPVLPDRHGGKFISVSLVGPVGWRYRIGAAVFLALILLGLYAAFVRGALHLTMLMIAPGLILLSLLPLLPEAIIRRFLIPAGRWSGGWKRIRECSGSLSRAPRS